MGEPHDPAAAANLELGALGHDGHHAAPRLWRNRHSALARGAPAGGGRIRLVPHVHELIDFTAEVFVVHDGRVLLRMHDKYGLWLSVGGHVELDEDPNEAAVREVREEVGLDVRLHDDLRPFEDDRPGHRELIPPKFMHRHRVDDTHEHVVLVFFARSETEEVVVPEAGDDRSEVWRWFTPAELDDEAYGVPEHIRVYARRALDELA